MNSVVEQMMGFYTDEHIDDSQKLREVMQKIALAGLYRGGFFSKAAFCGGTCLRLFHGLPRFSENMDFSLLEVNENFQIEDYFPSIIREFQALDIEVSLKRKEKSKEPAIESAFLKNDTSQFDIDISRVLKIKLEVDTQPPPGFLTESKVSLLPFSFMVRCYEIPYLYAEKMHALMYRSWRNRVKGRDWFDFEWYVRNNASLDFNHYKERVSQLSPQSEIPESIDEFKAGLRNRIDSIDYSLAKRDVAPFIADQSVLDIWSAEYFRELVELIRFQ